VTAPPAPPGPDLAPAAAAVSLPALPPAPAWPRRLLAPAIGVVVFAGMLYGLDRMIRAFRYRDLVDALGVMTPQTVAVALALLVAQHLLLAVREGLAVAYAGHRELGVGRIAVASIVSRSLSLLGIGPVTGFGLRYRIYTGWGLSTADVGRITAYNELTYYVGLAATLGVVLTFRDVPLPARLAGTLPSTRVVGALALAAHVGYLAWCVRHRGPLRLRKLVIDVPHGVPLAAQSVLHLADTALGAAVAYACLPPCGLSFPAFVAIFLIGGVIGSISQVPGGLGVFEAVVLFFVGGAASPTAVLAGLLVRRALTNLVPLGVGAALLLGLELRRNRAAPHPHPWLPEILSTTIAVVTFAAGVLLLVLAASPTEHGLLARAGLHGDLALVGLGLVTLFVARGLQHRRRRAWHLAVGLLAARAGLALIAGPSWLALAVIAPTAALLLACRRFFVEGGVAFEDHAGWRVALLMALAGTTWVGFYAAGDQWSQAVVVRTAAAIAALALATGVAVARVAARRRAA
jgi:phosphatidylglycerol lysyltransferase